MRAACAFVFGALVGCRDPRGAVEMAPNVFVAAREEWLEVHGATFAEAREAAASALWFKAAVAHLPSHSDVRVEWRYWWKTNSSNCFVADVRVDITVTHYFPRWHPDIGTAAEETTLWSNWLALRQRLAQRRVEAAVREGAKLSEVLLALPADPCEELRPNVVKLADNAVSKLLRDVNGVVEEDGPAPAPGVE